MRDCFFQSTVRQTGVENAVSGYFIKTSAILAMVAGISFSAVPSFAASSPLNSVSVAIQQGPEAAVLDELPVLKTPDAASSVKPATDDPLAWDVPAILSVKPATVGKVEALHNTEVLSDTASNKNGTLEMRVTALEKQVATLKEKSLSRKDIEELETSVGSLQQRIAEEKAAEQQVAPIESMEPKKSKKVKKSRPHKTKEVHSRLTPSKHWVLKAAKPGTAWVAEKDSTALRKVSVGDTLSGIGKIKSITKDSLGHWVVNGTGGRITQ